MRPRTFTAQYVIKAPDGLTAIDITEIHPALDGYTERQKHVLRHAERGIEIVEPGHWLPAVHHPDDTILVPLQRQGFANALRPCEETLVEIAADHDDRRVI